MIHQTAQVGKGAVLGKNVSIGAFSIVEDGAVIGDDCVLDSHTQVKRYTELGAGCKVHSGAVIGDVPQDLGFKDCESRVKVGAKTVIRECVTIHRGSKPGNVTEIGENCYLMACSHVGHDVKMGRNVILANGVLLAGHVTIGDRAFLSGVVVVHQFVRIGRLVMVGGGSGISKDVPPFMMVRPINLNLVTGLNVVGMRRSGIATAARADVKKAFMILYHSGLNVSQAVERIRKELSSAEVIEICDFIEGSKRGICACSTGGNSVTDDEE